MFFLRDKLQNFLKNASIFVILFSMNELTGGYCDSCSSCSLCDLGSLNEFEIGLELLYVKPCIDSLDILVQGSTSTQQTSILTTTDTTSYKCLPLGWEKGYRIRFGVDELFENLRLDASLTWINLKAKNECNLPEGDDSFVSSLLFIPSLIEQAPPINLVEGKYKQNYESWDVLFRYVEKCGPPKICSPFIGTAGVLLKQKIDVTGYDVILDSIAIEKIFTNWESDFLGFGLKIGVDYEIRLKQCWKFIAHTSGMITVGNQDGKILCFAEDGEDIDSALIEEFSDGSCCQIVPGYQLRVGLLRETTVCDMNFNIRISWEYTKWLNVSNPRVFSNSFFSTSRDVTTFGYYGLVAGLDLFF